MDTQHRETNSLADPLLLQKIDRLFACNVGEYVNLPQLVVVGDQSSGKSSVLEGLTGIAFPRDSGLCTRYATQIIFQRSIEARITVSVIPARGSDRQTEQTLKAWKKDLACLDKKSFLETISAADEVMGVGSGKSTFSQHVLQILITGPEEEHFSIIDIPGIFRTASVENATTEKDIATVRNMVQSYMENPRSILLAVIAANIDIANQEIIGMAKTCDPDGQRTLGVLTKPDLVDRGAESDFVGMLLGKRYKLRLGWTALRNPGKEDLKNPDFDRHAAEEDFFSSTKPWSTVEGDKLGAKALRQKLQEVLANHVRREFPNVRKEISQKVRSAKEALKSLGPSREHHNDQRSFLNTLATNFYTITHSAIRAQYDHPVFKQDPNLKIATKVANRNDAFANDMSKRGHMIRYAASFPGKSKIDENPSRDVSDSKELKQNTLGDIESVDENQLLQAIEAADKSSTHSTRKTLNHEELFELLSEDENITNPSNTDIMAWLEELHHESRGLTLETYPSSLIPQAVNEQCLKWGMIANGYISDVVCLVHTYILQLLQRVCPDDRIREELISVRLDALWSKYERAVKQVQFIVDVEATDPLTLNHYYSDTLENR